MKLHIFLFFIPAVHYHRGINLPEEEKNKITERILRAAFHLLLLCHSVGSIWPPVPLMTVAIGT